MKALTKAKTLRSILAEKLTKEDGWQITPVRQENGGHCVKCWHKFELRKKIGSMDLVYSHELNDIVNACDFFGASYYANIPYGKEGVIEDIDAIGQLHGTWGGLAVIPEADKFIVIG